MSCNAFFLSDRQGHKHAVNSVSVQTVCVGTDCQTVQVTAAVGRDSHSVEMDNC
jgi:hypothetical protein